jgi:hypothetical protein
MVVMRSPIWRQMSSMVRLHPVLDLGEGLFGRIEIGGIWWQVPKPCISGFNQAAQGSSLVATEVVHDDDVARLKLWDEKLLDIGAEAFAVDWTVEQARSGEAVAAQGAKEGQRPPVAMRREASHPFAFRPPPTQWSHVGLDPGFVDKDQALRVEFGLP